MPPPPFEEAGVYCFALVGRSVRRSVGPLVGPSVGRSVGRSVDHIFVRSIIQKSVSGIILKLQRWIDLIKDKRSAQES